MSQKPWRKIGSKLVHANPWFSILEDDVIRPDGKNGKYFVVTPKKDSVAVIPVDEDGSIYLVGQTRYPAGCIFSWEIVAGRMEGDLSPLENAKRELEEEAGLEAEEWQDIGTFYPIAGTENYKCHVFIARKLKETKAKPEPTEDIAIKKVTKDELAEMILNNEIIDGFTLAPLLKYWLASKLRKDS